MFQDLNQENWVLGRGFRLGVKVRILGLWFWMYFIMCTFTRKVAMVINLHVQLFNNYGFNNYGVFGFIS